MEPERQPLVMYGEPSDAPPLDWAWVQRELSSAGTYWVVPRGDGHPHPRPMWGLWDAGALHLSVGSPVVARALAAHPEATIHLDSGTDVVIVEGTVTGPCDDSAVLARYDAKYDWDYAVDRYGPLTSVAASTVMAWRAAGPAGRDGFRHTGRWLFPT